MSQQLKCVIFGDRDVIKKDDEIFSQVKRLIKYLIIHNIQPIILSNYLTKERLDLEKELEEECKQLQEEYPEEEYPEFVWIIAGRDGTPKKAKPESVQWVLNNYNFQSHEAIMIGNSKNDMITAVNSGLLFVNASWYGKNTDYGFELDQPWKVARFVDVFCLRDNLWNYAINSKGLEYYSLGIYGTREEKYNYSRDAKEAAKFGRGHLDFWMNYFLSAIYFSGLHKRIDYIASYPSHRQGSISSVMEQTIVTFAKCFRKTYLKDLIIRHTTAEKSAYARSGGKGDSLNHLNQLNTIRLNPSPLKNEKGERYKKSPLQPGKTVLLIDDFCTEGYSLEAARVYIEQTGANVICLSLLKTICRDYKQIENIENIDKFDPFQPQTFSLSDIQTIEHSYSRYISTSESHYEIREKLKRYDGWVKKYSEQ